MNSVIVVTLLTTVFVYCHSEYIFSIDEIVPDMNYLAVRRVYTSDCMTPGALGNSSMNSSIDVFLYMAQKIDVEFNERLLNATINNTYLAFLAPYFAAHTEEAHATKTDMLHMCCYTLAGQLIMKDVFVVLCGIIISLFTVTTQATVCRRLGMLFHY
jgi:hypothetical protein